MPTCRVGFSGPFHVRALSSEPVTPLLIVAIGLAVLAIGLAALLAFGPRYRIGRLLATVPRVSVGEALLLAAGPEPRYVRIEGRIDSEEDFEDADHRPLVLRRTRVEARTGLAGRWHTFEHGHEAVPFQLNEGLDSILIDEAALDAGLVVVTRQSVGVAGDLGDRLAAVPPAAPTRVTIEQVSSVEHAIALGVPVLNDDGGARLTAGLGRPLILTTLEIPEAMRILTGGAVRRSRLVAACLAGGTALVVIGAFWWLITAVTNPVVALAASPLPSILPGADTRSSGEGPGLVGNPGLALLVVVGIALVAIGTTLLYVRLTRGRTAG
jgi:hypothetical protein